MTNGSCRTRLVEADAGVGRGILLALPFAGGADSKGAMKPVRLSSGFVVFGSLATIQQDVSTPDVQITVDGRAKEGRYGYRV